MLMGERSHPRGEGIRERDKCEVSGPEYYEKWGEGSLNGLTRTFTVVLLQNKLFIALKSAAVSRVGAGGNEIPESLSPLREDLDSEG